MRMAIPVVYITHTV